MAFPYIHRHVFADQGRGSENIPSTYNTKTSPLIGFKENTIQLTSSSINLALGNCFTYTATSDVTFEFSGASQCQTFTLVLTNGGNHTIGFPSTTQWIAGEPPELTDKDVLVFTTYDGGTSWVGLVSIEDAQEHDYPDPLVPTPGFNWGGILIPSNATVAPTGRCWYRHSSGMGSVMCWDDNGTRRQTLVLDMAYHNSSMFWSSGSVAVPGITNYTSYPFSNYYIRSEGSSTTPSDYNGCTDAYIDGRLQWRDAGTSKANTDAMMACSECSGTSYIAGHCRSKTVVGVGCDVPNMQTLVRIFCDRATIHGLDETDVSDRWTNWFAMDNVWSSSEYDSEFAWCVNFEGCVLAWNKAGLTGDGDFYFIPVLEL